jgi:hypothetical protein
VEKSLPRRVQAMPFPCSYHLGWDQSLACIMLCIFLEFRERIQVFPSRMCDVRRWCYILPQLTYWHHKDWYSDGAPCPWSQWNMSLSTVNLITFIGHAVPVGTITHKLSCTCQRKLEIFCSRSPTDLMLCLDTIPFQGHRNGVQVLVKIFGPLIKGKLERWEK